MFLGSLRVNHWENNSWLFKEREILWLSDSERVREITSVQQDTSNKQQNGRRPSNQLQHQCPQY